MLVGGGIMAGEVVHVSVSSRLPPMLTITNSLCSYATFHMRKFERDTLFIHPPSATRSQVSGLSGSQYCLNLLVLTITQIAISRSAIKISPSEFCQFNWFPYWVYFNCRIRLRSYGMEALHRDVTKILRITTRHEIATGL